MTVALRPYQEAASLAFRDAVLDGRRRLIVSLPTGTGKTIMGASLARFFGPRTLWITHREELVQQTVQAFRAVWPEQEPGMVVGNYRRMDCPVMIAGIQKLCTEASMSLLHDTVPYFGPVSFVIVDEAHHSTAPTYRRVLQALGCPNAEGQHVGPPVLGLTATVERGDGRGLDGVWEGVAYNYKLLDAIRDGYLVPFTSRNVNLPIDWSKIRSVAGDFNQGDLAAELMRSGAAEATALAVAAHGKGRKTLVFTVSVNQAKRTAKRLREMDVTARAVWGEMDPGDRKAAREEFRTGKVQVICNAMLWTEGFDEPTVSCVAVARPTRSRPMYLQMIGRGTRLHPGKRDMLIIDLVQAGDRHGVVQAGDLGGVERNHAVRASESVGDAPAKDGELALVSGYVDQANQGTRINVQWVTVKDDAVYAMSAPDAAILLVRRSDSTRWDVYAVERNKGTVPWCLTAHEDDVDLALAQGIGEDHARKLGAFAFGPEAPWRGRPVTDRQRMALHRWKLIEETKAGGRPCVPALDGRDLALVTSGEASDLLLAKMAKVEVSRHGLR